MHLTSTVVHTRAELMADGVSGRAITHAVRDGRLLRLRRDRYALPAVSPDIAEAVRVGGRLGCVSLLRSVGVFILDDHGAHVHVDRARSRLRPPHPTTVLHWVPEGDDAGSRHAVTIGEALRLAVCCQSVRASIATLDSALRLRLISRAELSDLRRSLPRRFRVLFALADGTAESGPETFLRLILRTIGVPFAAQAWVDRVGRVDFLVEGWLILECDSREFHGGWEAQREDRRRDLEAAEQGYVTVRLLAEDLFHRPEQIRQSLENILATFTPIRRRRR